jgi:hypothetical protein
MREQKITLGEMPSAGPTHLLNYSGDYKCAHSVVIDSLRWPDDVRLSDLQSKFTCQACASAPRATERNVTGARRGLFYQVPDHRSR